jgi:hypothetical protein
VTSSSSNDPLTDACGLPMFPITGRGIDVKIKHSNLRNECEEIECDQKIS